MRTDPKTEQQIMEENLMPDGIYPFEVVEATDAVSKSGNEMIVLKLRIVDDQNIARTLKDYLLASMAFKLRHFCVQTGLMDKYDADDLKAMNCVGKKGMVEITSDKTPRFAPDGKQYPVKNSVKDYPKDAVVPAPASASPEYDDSIPF